MSLFKSIGLVAFASVSMGGTTAMASPYFNRVNSFPVAQNAPEADETSAEIIAASADGSWLVYSDSPAGGVGFIGLTDDGRTEAKGFLALGGEPTSVTVVGTHVFAGVNTSKSYTAPSGHVAVIDAKGLSIVKTCELGGQPDSIAASKDGTMLAVAIENERDEDLNDGLLPQLPAGYVSLFKLVDNKLDCASQIKVDLTGLAAVGGADPEPEFVDFNAAGELVVSLQENNHLVVLDGATGEIKNHFSAGAVDLANVDTEEERAFTFDGSLRQVAREPDAVKWLDEDRFVTANEGDYKGGSRGFTIWNKDGSIVWDSGMSVDHLVARLGHYPEKRSGNKGSEPEGLDVAKFGDDTLIFVLLERASLVLVYKDTGAAPEFIQALPSGIGPEGAVAIPSKNLLATANEVDLRKDGGPGSHVMIYARTAKKPAYPQIMSEMAGERPIGWTALSGLVADSKVPGKLYAVNDSFLRLQPSIYEIDATQSPAKIVRRIGVTRNGAPAQKLDLEGIALDGKGGFWLASEGRTGRLTPHALYHVNGKGKIKEEVAFPTDLLAVEKRFGAEGITAVGTGDDMVLWIAIQREWADDAKGEVKLVSYTPATGEWGAVRYPLGQGEKGWVGLSEITAYGDKIYVVERDNQLADKAKIKKLYAISMDQMQAAPLGGELPLVEKTEVHDFLPDMKKLNGFVLDKIEGFAVDAAGEGFAMTDNDGVDDHSGETLFFSIGKM